MIAYSQCWEDAELVIKALQINEQDTVLSITSGGCNTLAIACSNPKTIYSVDSNCNQNYLLELKQKAIAQLTHSEVIDFLGYSSCSNRLEIFQKLLPYLSENAQNYWNAHIKDIESGIIHCGKFEKYLALFRRMVLPLIHSKKRIKELTNPKNKEQQAIFYTKKWNNLRWRWIFKLFFSKLFMSGRGRKKEMFDQDSGNNVAIEFFNRTQKAFMLGPVKNNFYLNYILHKKSAVLPKYLQLNKNKGITSSCVKIIYTDLLSFLKSKPDNSISKFNLSDVFEPLPVELTRAIFKELYRTASNSARIIFWNNLVVRDVPKELKSHFQQDLAQQEELEASNQVFFYEKFFIYLIKK